MIRRLTFIESMYPLDVTTDVGRDEYVNIYIYVVCLWEGENSLYQNCRIVLSSEQFHTPIQADIDVHWPIYYPVYVDTCDTARKSKGLTQGHPTQNLLDQSGARMISHGQGSICRKIVVYTGI